MGKSQLKLLSRTPRDFLHLDTAYYEDEHPYMSPQTVIDRMAANKAAKAANEAFRLRQTVLEAAAYARTFPDYMKSSSRAPGTVKDRNVISPPSIGFKSSGMQKAGVALKDLELCIGVKDGASPAYAQLHPYLQGINTFILRLRFPGYEHVNFTVELSLRRVNGDPTTLSELGQLVALSWKSFIREHAFVNYREPGIPLNCGKGVLFEDLRLVSIYRPQDEKPWECRIQYNKPLIHSAMN